MNLHRIRFIIVGLILLISIIGIIAWSRSSNTGTVTTQYHKSADPVALEKKLDGTHFSLRYQNRYAKRILPAHDNDIELYELRANTVYDKRLSVEITRLPSGVLTDDGSYNFRRVHPEDYRERLVDSAEGQAHIMMKSDGKEQTVFMAHEGRLATLAFVSDGAADQLQSEVNGVVASFLWKP